MPLWTPAEITTALVLDSADTSTITVDGTAVTAISDKSGNSRNFIQSTASYRPIVGATINDIGAIQFDGTNDFLYAPLAADFLANTAKSIFVVFQGRGVGTYDFAVSSRINFGGVDNSEKGFLSVADTRTIYVHTGKGDSIVTSALSRETAYQIGFTVGANAASPAHYRDGSALTLTTNTLIAAAAENSAGYMVLGQQAGAFAGGNFGELIWINGVVDTTTRQLIEGYLAWKWGLEANLPADHPYKSAAPTINKVSGVVTVNGSPAARTVAVFRRSDFTLLGTTTSNATTGAFEILNDLIPADANALLVTAIDSTGTYNAVSVDYITSVA